MELWPNKAWPNKPSSTENTSLGQFHLLLAATGATKNTHQLPLFDIKLFFLNHLPLVKTTAAQGFAFVFFKRTRFFKRNDVAHGSRRDQVRGKVTPRCPWYLPPRSL